VVIKLVDAQQSGKLTGRAGPTLNLAAVKVNGRMVDVNTRTVSRESSSRGKRTAEVAGGTAALGAIIGAIAGGGKGSRGRSRCRRRRGDRSRSSHFRPAGENPIGNAPDLRVGHAGPILKIRGIALCGPMLRTKACCLHR